MEDVRKIPIARRWEWSCPVPADKILVARRRISHKHGTSCGCLY